jgi:FKBP-type peptidyl-prolyl cis-trans isomerase 2
MQVKNGDTIAVHYKGFLTDGTVFDSSEGREPLSFTVGGGMVIAGFDKGVLEMKIGDTKTINIPFMEAYGPTNEEMMMKVPLAEVPQDMKLELGMEVHLTDDAGNVMPVQVIALDDSHVTLDGNHPLAGKDLNFDLELVSIS